MCVWGEVDGPLAVSLLVELELREKNERVGRDEWNTMVPQFKGPFYHVTCDATKTSKIPENATSLLIEQELRDNDERIPRDHRRMVIPIFIVLGHWLTSEVRSKFDKITPFE